MRFQGKVALVTGGGSGIGEACCQRLAGEGAQVAIVDRQIEHAERVAGLIGANAIALQADVTDAEAIARAVNAAARHFGRLDAAINNAGIGGNLDPLEDTPIELWDRIVAVNLSGVFYGMRAQYPHLVRAGGGAIVNVSSILGTTGFAEAGAYVAAKHGVIGLTKSAALSWGAEGIRVTAICPTFIRTPLTDPMPEENWAVLLKHHPLGRLPLASEVAGLAAFLASDEAAAITGSAHHIDAGYTAG